MSKRTVFFDLFDTLVRVDRGYLEPYFDRETDRLGDNGTLKNAEMTIDRLTDMHPQLLEKYTKEEMCQYYRDCMTKSLINVDQNVLDMLAELKENGYGLCVISDAAYVYIESWDQSQLSQYFDQTAFSCEIGFVKPDPRLFETAKEMMGNPIECVFAGDGGHDELIGAHNTNMQTIKAEWIKNRRVEELYKEADYRIQETEKVAETVREMDFSMNRNVEIDLLNLNDVVDKSEIDIDFIGQQLSDSVDFEDVIDIEFENDEHDIGIV